MSRRSRHTEKVAPGDYTLVCRLCGQEGLVRLTRVMKDNKAEMFDFIPHQADCLHGPQARAKTAPPWLGKTARRKVRQQESSANALVGARGTLASGAVRGDHDGRAAGEWSVECKQTTGEFRLTSTYWNEFSFSAEQRGEEPLLHVQTPKGKFCGVRAAYFNSLREILPATLIPEDLESPVFPLHPPDKLHRIGGPSFREDIYVMPESIFLMSKQLLYGEQI